MKDEPILDKAAENLDDAFTDTKAAEIELTKAADRHSKNMKKYTCCIVCLLFWITTMLLGLFY